MALSNFLIVGAAKSITTSMYQYLAPYPQIAKDDLGCESLFPPVDKETASSEASITYLQDPEALKRIKELLGNIKILIFIRNPSMRAYAAWWQNGF